MTDEEIKILLEHNTVVAQETHDMVVKIHSYIKWMRIMDIVKILLIVIPLIASIIFLPAIISQLSAGYGAILPTELTK